ncbi:MAG: penicillin-binding protein 2 [Candidatus Neomarinimicrobiota bacterium]
MLKSEIRVPRVKRRVADGVVMVLLSVLVARLYYLQVYRHEKFQELADYNRIRPVTIHAPRGLILDRDGRVLASNRFVYTISVIRDELVDEETEFEMIARYLDVPAGEIEANLNKYYRDRFLPAMVSREVSFRNLSLIEEHRDDLPGVIYSKFPVRRYSNKAEVNASHILGYLREISREELDRHDGEDYAPGDFSGAHGIEKRYDSRLRGKKGSLFLQVDALGREVGPVKERDPIPAEPGENIYLTIDARLQGYVERLLRDRTGAAVVLNAASGEVLALVSMPDYPLDDFAGFIEMDTWAKHSDNESRPLFNRSVSGLYPPGSAIKPITAIMALENGLVDLDWTVTCTGEYLYGDRIFGCWVPEGHGKVNLMDAITESCNIYFYHLIQKADLDTWFRYARLFGFGQKTGIDLPEENSGIAPNTTFMNDKYGENSWSGGHLLNVAIGQGDVLVTPIQMARFMATVAMRGFERRPRLTLEERSSEKETEGNRMELEESTWDIIQRAMWNVLNSPKGTAFSSRVPGGEIDFFGKTGTSENPHGEPHAWFIGFARKGEETIAFSTLVEHGGKGGSTAAPLARRIVEHYFGADSLKVAIK